MIFYKIAERKLNEYVEKVFISYYWRSNIYNLYSIFRVCTRYGEVKLR